MSCVTNCALHSRSNTRRTPDLEQAAINYCKQRICADCIRFLTSLLGLPSSFQDVSAFLQKSQVTPWWAGEKSSSCFQVSLCVWQRAIYQDVNLSSITIRLFSKILVALTVLAFVLDIYLGSSLGISIACCRNINQRCQHHNLIQLECTYWEDLLRRFFSN
jgi:hypothetical protein